MKILVIGGDGFCGWPIALHLSILSYEVGIVDDLSRRKIDKELKIKSLTPIQTVETRLKIWKEKTGKEINFFSVSVGEEFDLLKIYFLFINQMQ